MLGPLAAGPEPELRQAAGLFGSDVLGRWGSERPKVRRWHTPTDRKDYASRDNGRHRVYPEHLLAHLTGETALAAAPLSRVLIIDADLDGLPDDEEAPDEAKLERARDVSAILGELELPHVVFDSAGGFHVWIRLHRYAKPAERRALAALLEPLTAREPRFKFEVFPDGEKPLRLPLGLYLGRPRGALIASEGFDPLRWLAWPERATEQQLAALVAAAPAPVDADTQPATPAPRIWTPAPPVIVLPPAAPGPLELSPEPPAGINRAVWERMRRAVQGLATHGCQLAGMSDKADLALFNEVGLAGETDPEAIVEAILTIEHPVSRTSYRQRERRVRWIVANYTPRPFGCCQLHPLAEGETDRSAMRATIRPWCDHRCAQTCHIYNRRAAADVTEGYGRVAHASFWLDARGKAANYSGSGTFGQNGYGIWQYVVRSHQDVQAGSVLADPGLFARRLGIHHKTASRLLHEMLAAGLLAHTDRSRRELRAPEPAESHIRRVERLTGGQARARARKIRAEEARCRLDALWDRRARLIFGRGG